MSAHKNLADFIEDIARCVQCGACQAHCPAYLSGWREGDVARGKIALAAALLNGSLAGQEAVDRVARDMDMCLMCGSCVAGCPNEVPTDEIVGAVRREITEKNGLSFVGKSISSLLDHPGLMALAGKSGAALAPLVMKKVPKSSGLRLRFPFDCLPSLSTMAGRTMPQPALKNLFQRLPEYVAGEPGKPVVAFFAGCSISYLTPELGEKMVTILHALGCSIHIPRGQRCCGIPALSSGDGALVEKLAVANTAAFAEVSFDTILTACASCSGGIGEYYRTMDNVSPSFSGKVKNISVFLEEVGLATRLASMARWRQPRRVSWHDPCHMKKQGIFSSPRAILRALPNVDFIEMEGAARCCGLGGSFSVYHYDRSKKIGERKMEGLAEANVELVATACPGCILQLQDSINHAAMPVRAVHLLDLIAEAFAGER